MIRDGPGSFESFWAQFENCASYNRCSDADKLAHVKASLTGDAGQVLWDTDAAPTDTTETFVVAAQANPCHHCIRTFVA